MGVVTTVVGRTVVPLVGGTGVEAVDGCVGGDVAPNGTPLDTGVVPTVVVVCSTHAMIPTVT
jgi:hypothetical protein